MDAIRAGITGKHRIGGLGATVNNNDFTIMRGSGRHVKSNKEKIAKIENYMTITCMKNAIITSREAYDSLVLAM